MGSAARVQTDFPDVLQTVARKGYPDGMRDDVACWAPQAWPSPVLTDGALCLALVHTILPTYWAGPSAILRSRRLGQVSWSVYDDAVAQDSRGVHQ